MGVGIGVVVIFIDEILGFLKVLRIPPLAVGIGSVAAPFLVMQPGMGAGIAARRTPRPGAARFQSLVTHAIFGLGLYATGWSINRF